MRRSPVGVAAMLAMASVRAHSHAQNAVIVPPPLPDDHKPEPRVVRASGGSYIPFQNLHHVSRETLNRPADPFFGGRPERRERRKARMRLRKRRGWR